MSGELGHMIDINILYISVGQLGGWMSGQNNILCISTTPGRPQTPHYAIFYVHGSVGNKPIDFLLDPGAAISVRYYLIRDPTSAAVSANGAPLDVTGKVILTVTLGSLSVIQEFTVVLHLIMDCLLGADFLKNTILLLTMVTLCFI